MRNQLNNLPEEVKANNAEIIEVLTRVIDAMEKNETNDAAIELYNLTCEREECGDLVDMDLAFEIVKESADLTAAWYLMKELDNFYNCDILRIDVYGALQVVDGDYVEMIIEEILENLEA